LKKFIVNFIKGTLIGIGAVLPGLSGGALAAVFGIYEPLMAFLSNIKKQFMKNVCYFFPFMLGGLFGIYLLSHVLNYLLAHNLAELSIFFVGCMLGVFPTLVKQAGKKGQKVTHLIIAIIATVVSFMLLTTFSSHSEALSVQTASWYLWALSGSLIGLGLTFPGLSPSNFLIFLGLYQPINLAISNLDFPVLMPVAIGGIVTVLTTAKLVTYVLGKFYAVVYHVILGLVITSTVMIVPRNFNSGFVLAICLLAGLMIGMFMTYIENNAKEKVV